MTVLQESASLGSSSRGLKKTLAVVAILVAGAGAGYGLSQRTDVTATIDAMSVRAPTTVQHIEILHRTGQAQIEKMRANRLLQQRINTGLVQKAEIAKNRAR